MKWKHLLRYWSFVRGIYRSPVDSPHKGQWRGAFMFSLICAWTNGWANNRDAGDSRRHLAHHDVTVMKTKPGYKLHSTSSEIYTQLVFSYIWLRFGGDYTHILQDNFTCNQQFTPNPSASEATLNGIMVKSHERHDVLNNWPFHCLFKYFV